MNVYSPSRLLPMRSTMRSPFLRRTLAAAVVAALPLAASAQAPRDTMRTRVGDQTLTLIQQPTGQVSVVSSASGRHTLSLPARAYLSTLQGAGKHWYAAGVDENASPPRLLLLRGTDGRTTELATPETASPLLVNPVLVGDGETLGALLWLEGDRFDTLAVRVARVDGDGFGTPETIAPAGPGTQIALSAVQLADGSMLAAWSAFDGEDDEILWSRTTRRGWSAPARVEEDDAVPDVTPSLRALSAGALLTWSSYDGNDYRVRLARFEGGAWSTTETIGGKGSVQPTFADVSPVPVVIYKTAVPRTWTVLALGGADDNRPRAKGSIPLETERRPLIDRSDDGHLSVHWPALEHDAGPTAKRSATRLEMRPLDSTKRLASQP